MVNLVPTLISSMVLNRLMNLRDCRAGGYLWDLVDSSALVWRQQQLCPVTMSLKVFAECS